MRTGPWLLFLHHLALACCNILLMDICCHTWILVLL